MVAAIFLPLCYSLLSLKNSQLLLTIAKKLTEKLVIGIQPVVKRRKTHLSDKSFKKLKFMNLLSVLDVERAYKLKRNSASFSASLWPRKRSFINLLTWISSVLRKSAIVSADQSVENFDCAN